MFLLNLPEYDHKITKKNGELYVYDKIRKKNLVDIDGFSKNKAT